MGVGTSASSRDRRLWASCYRWPGLQCTSGLVRRVPSLLDRGEFEGSATSGAGQVENPLYLVLDLRIYRQLGRQDWKSLALLMCFGAFCGVVCREATTEVALPRLLRSQTVCRQGRATQGGKIWTLCGRPVRANERGSTCPCTRVEGRWHGRADARERSPRKLQGAARRGKKARAEEALPRISWRGHMSDMTGQMDVVQLREIKRRVKKLISYYRGAAGVEHPFVLELQERLAGVTLDLECRGEASGRRRRRRRR